VAANPPLVSGTAIPVSTTYYASTYQIGEKTLPLFSVHVASFKNAFFYSFRRFKYIPCNNNFNNVRFVHVVIGKSPVTKRKFSLPSNMVKRHVLPSRQHAFPALATHIASTLFISILQ
jgi:hypothetical protein